MVVKIRVPFWVPIIIRHLLFRVTIKRDPNFDNHPYTEALIDQVQFKVLQEIRGLSISSRGTGVRSTDILMLYRRGLKGSKF